ncbi:hypothetical protein B566_EDAN001457 [Ephemera danica]|nr:hypothetical protein B566_EDAN001457 [Ephemera danica]
MTRGSTEQHRTEDVITTTVIVSSVLLLTVIGLRMALYLCRRWRQPHPPQAVHRDFTAPSIFMVHVEPVLERPAGAPPTYDEAQHALGLPLPSGTLDSTPTLTSVPP